jgi:hypothetical protein
MDNTRHQASYTKFSQFALLYNGMFLGFWMDFFGLIFTSVKTMSWSESPGHGWFVTTRSRVLDPLVGCFTSCAIPLSFT